MEMRTLTIYNKYRINYDYRDVLLQYFKDIGNIIEFEADSLIEFEYKKLDYIYLIKNGIVKQSFIDINGVEKTLLVLSTGDTFGEITMIQKDYDQVITKTFSSATVSKISKNKFYDCLHNNLDLYNNILLMITTKFRIIMSQIHDESYLDTEGRLYNLLKRLSIQHGSKYQYGTKIDLSFTHEELANMINSTRSTVTKLINKLECEKKILRNGKDIIII